jgi:hypothetical protein
VSILDGPRIHFSGVAFAHVPTGSSNAVPAVDLSTNRCVREGSPVDSSVSPAEFHRYLEEAGERYDAEGARDPRGELSTGPGWDFEGNNQFWWSATVDGWQQPGQQPVRDDALVGSAVELWGHYNPYLGTTANRARMVHNDPASKWSAQVISGLLTLGRRGRSTSVPNLFSGVTDGPQHARWITSRRILDVGDHVLAPTMAGAAVFQSALPSGEHLWGDDLPPSLAALRAATDEPDALGLVVRYAVFNTAAPSGPNQPARSQLSGTIGVWRRDELATHPAGRMLVGSRAPGRPPCGNAAVHVTDHVVSLDLAVTVPFSGRSHEPVGPLHPLGNVVDVGLLELRTASGTVVARIPRSVYASAHGDSAGVVDVPTLDTAGVDGESLVLVADADGPDSWVAATERAVVVQTDRANLYVEHPDHRTGDLFEEEVEFRSFVLGRPSAVQGVHLHQFHNPRCFAGDRGRSPARQVLGFRVGDGVRRQESASFDTDLHGRGTVRVSGVHAGTCRVLVTLDADRFAPPLREDVPDPATYAFDDDDELGFWGGASSMNVRVLPDDWHLADVPASQVDFPFLYEHVLHYYELVYPFMSEYVFSLADESKTETYARLMWQMCKPEYRTMSWYMPPTRELSRPKAELFRRYLEHVERVGHVPSTTEVKETHRLPAGRGLLADVRDAIDLELGVMVQYLYAAYSIPNRKTGERYVAEGMWPPEAVDVICGDAGASATVGWRVQLLRTAKEEMIHFLAANNILMSLGEPFYVPTRRIWELSDLLPVDVDLALEPFSAGALQRFIVLEWPDYYVPEVGGADTSDASHLYGSISELYRHIRLGLELLPDAAFRWPCGEGGEHHLFLNEFVNRQHPEYQLQVSDKQAALFTVDFVTSQGEGVSPSSPLFEDSHFQRYRRMAQELAQLDAARAATSPRLPPLTVSYPAVRNPTRERVFGDCTVVSDATALDVMGLFEDCYELMFFLVQAHYSVAPGSSLRKSKFMNTAIDVMTGALRPLALTLMSTPSGKPGRTAGPSFALGSPTEAPPDAVASCRHAAGLFQRLARRSAAIATVPSSVSELLGLYARYFDALADHPELASSPEPLRRRRWT